MKDQVTKEFVEKYEQVRSSGKFNMIVEAKAAIAEIGCSVSTYFEIVEHYSELMKNFGVERR